MLLIIAFSLFGVVAAQEDTAALIVTGRKSEDAHQSLNTVELFGCFNDGRSIYVDDLPERMIFTSGVYLPEKEAVLVCGGLVCQPGDLDCVETNRCHSLSRSEGWQDAQPLLEANYGQLIALGPNLEQVNNSSLSPIALGHSLDTEILSSDVHGWSPYLPMGDNLPFDIWDTKRCIIQEGNIVYFANLPNIVKIHLDTWQFETISGGGGNTGTNVGKCAKTTIKGEGTGIYLYKNNNKLLN